MESSLIYEGFKHLYEVYDLKINKYIADADSSVFHKIQHELPWGENVEKVDCINHQMKNVKGALFTEKKNFQSRQRIYSRKNKPCLFTYKKNDQ